MVGQLWKLRRSRKVSFSNGSSFLLVFGRDSNMVDFESAIRSLQISEAFPDFH